MLRKVVISGGGTGGHIFPAIAIANAIKAKHPECDILFLGANGKMEMDKVPAAGYEIVGLDVAGLKRKLTLENIRVIIKFLRSSAKAKKIIKNFNPDVAIGVGGYASAPTLKSAAKLNIKTVLQEQNSFAGLTNKLLGKNAEKICVAYDGMDKFFDKNKLVLTGNPVRGEVVDIEGKRQVALDHFKLKLQKTVLIIGGSGGAKTINESTIACIEKMRDSDVQFIWQCGKFYQKESEAYLEKNPNSNVRLMPFIGQMDLAYAAADVVVSRAGAISVSEICLVGKPAIFIPSPNVAEDHQTKNAKALVEHDAAILVKDVEAVDKLPDVLHELLINENQCKMLSVEIKKMGKPNAASEILNVIESVVG